MFNIQSIAIFKNNKLVNTMTFDLFCLKYHVNYLVFNDEKYQNFIEFLNKNNVSFNNVQEIIDLTKEDKKIDLIPCFDLETFQRFLSNGEIEFEKTYADWVMFSIDKELISSSEYDANINLSYGLSELFNIISKRNKIEIYYKLS